MATIQQITKSFRFNAQETVDTIFSKLLIANLFKNQTFVEGQTFTDKYNERGGQIYVRRLGKIEATHTKTTDADGLDFKHTNTQDNLALIQKADRISISEKCYDIVQNLRASGKSVDKMDEVIDSFKERCQMLYMSYLLAEPQTDDDGAKLGGATRSANTSKITTLDDLIASILENRKQILTNGGSADVLIISPDMEQLFLQSAVKAGNAFIPETNEKLKNTGKIGRLFNLETYTSNLIGSGTPLGKGSASKNTGIASQCEYILYDHDTFAICGDIETLRLVPAIDFTGSYAQIEGIMGGGVANPALAYAKLNDSVVTTRTADEDDKETLAGQEQGKEQGKGQEKEKKQ